MHLKLRVVNPLAWVAVILQPVMFSGIALVLFVHAGGAHVAFAVLGGGLVGLWAATLFDAGLSIDAERLNGTLEEIACSPSPLLAITAGKVAASLSTAVLSFIACVALALVVVRVNLLLDLPLFVPSLFLTLLGFYSFALVLAPLLVMWRFGPGFLNAFEIGLYLLCGFMFPVGVLPPLVQSVSSLLAPTWSIAAMYGAAQEGAVPSAWWLVSIGLVGVNGLLALLLFARVMNNLRRSGQLAMA
jgi:ABC-2 type transport system permease protein